MNIFTFTYPHSKVYDEPTKKKISNLRADDITRNPSHFVHAILPDCGVLKVQQSMPGGIRLHKKTWKDWFEARNV